MCTFPSLRNNLTVIDTILLHGRGATESLKVAGKPPGQGSSLRFKMTEALLKECTESESAVHTGPTAQPFLLSCSSPSPPSAHPGRLGIKTQEFPPPPSGHNREY